MAALVGAGRPIMRPILLSQIGNRDDGIELSAYLAAILASAPPAQSLPAFIDAWLRASGRRKILFAVEAVKDKVAAAPLDTSLEDIVEEARNAIAAADLGGPEDSKRLGDLVAQVILEANEVITTNKPPGYRTGLRAWDDLVGWTLAGQFDRSWRRDEFWQDGACG